MPFKTRKQKESADFRRYGLAEKQLYSLKEIDTKSKEVARLAMPENSQGKTGQIGSDLHYVFGDLVRIIILTLLIGGAQIGLKFIVR